MRLNMDLQSPAATAVGTRLALPILRIGRLADPVTSFIVGNNISHYTPVICVIGKSDWQRTQYSIRQPKLTAAGQLGVSKSLWRGRLGESHYRLLSKR